MVLGIDRVEAVGQADEGIKGLSAEEHIQELIEAHCLLLFLHAVTDLDLQLFNLVFLFFCRLPVLLDAPVDVGNLFLDRLDLHVQVFDDSLDPGDLGVEAVDLNLIVSDVCGDFLFPRFGHRNLRFQLLVFGGHVIHIGLARLLLFLGQLTFLGTEIVPVFRIGEVIFFRQHTDGIQRAQGGHQCCESI